MEVRNAQEGKQKRYRKLDVVCEEVWSICKEREHEGKWRESGHLTSGGEASSAWAFSMGEEINGLAVLWGSIARMSRARVSFPGKLVESRLLDHVEVAITN